MPKTTFWDTILIVVHVAQLDRVLPSEGRGHEFDSRHEHQIINKPLFNKGFSFRTELKENLLQPKKALERAASF